MFRKLVSVAALLVILAAAGSPSEGLAQSTTDWNTITYFVDLDGVNEAVYRRFEAPGTRFVGPYQVITYIARFETPEQAKAGISEVRDRVFEYLETLNNMEGVRKASIKKIGDQTVAYAGNVELLNPEPNQATGYTAALVFFRQGEFVYYLRGAAILNVDPTLDTFAVARAIAGRQPGEPTVAESAQED